jgi:hypothetical protein
MRVRGWTDRRDETTEMPVCNAREMTVCNAREMAVCNAS